MGKTIDVITAFIVDHPDAATGETHEGVMAFQSGPHWVPMISSDPRRADELRPMALALAVERGVTVREVSFIRSEL